MTQTPPELPEPVDHLAAADGFNVIGTQDVFTAEQIRERDAMWLEKLNAAIAQQAEPEGCSTCDTPRACQYHGCKQADTPAQPVAQTEAWGVRFDNGVKSGWLQDAHGFPALYSRDMAENSCISQDYAARKLRVLAFDITDTAAQVLAQHMLTPSTYPADMLKKAQNVDISEQQEAQDDRALFQAWYRKKYNVSEQLWPHGAEIAFESYLFGRASLDAQAVRSAALDGSAKLSDKKICGNCKTVTTCLEMGCGQSSIRSLDGGKK